MRLKWWADSSCVTACINYSTITIKSIVLCDSLVHRRNENSLSKLSIVSTIVIVLHPANYNSFPSITRKLQMRNWNYDAIGCFPINGEQFHPQNYQNRVSRCRDIFWKNKPPQEETNIGQFFRVISSNSLNSKYSCQLLEYFIIHCAGDVVATTEARYCPGCFRDEILKSCRALTEKPRYEFLQRSYVYWTNTRIRRRLVQSANSHSSLEGSANIFSLLSNVFL